MRKRVYLAAVILIPLAVSAESLHDRIQQANGLLKSGEVDKALDAYHELQIDHPDSPVLDYNVGCAEYEKGVRTIQSDKKSADKAALSRAVDQFNRAMQSGDPKVSNSAAYNRATTLAQTAKLLGNDEPQPERVKAFQDAIRAYEDVLKADPDNEGAKQNIDHLRYAMKLATLPPPPQQGGEDSKQQENQGNDKNQPNPDASQPNEEQNEQKPDNQPQQQDEQNQQDNQNTSSQQSQGKEQQDQSNAGQDQSQAANPLEQEEDRQQSTGTPPPDRQAVEALLQNLDDQDKQLQKELNKGERTTRVRASGWW